MRKLFFITSLFLVSYLISYGQSAPQKITFPSLDGVTITADVYHLNDSLPVILLCHQASYSRGEYIETGPKLNELGFNCMAIDQRAGQAVNTVANRTAVDARDKHRPMNYLDAELDMVAAINYLVVKYKKNVILLGSSYSASLALKLAKEHERVSAVIVFSPGEYFGSKLNLKEKIHGLDKPVFATCSRGEAPKVKEILAVVDHATCFIPKAPGAHGSKVLWSTHKDQQEYWDALIPFLETLK